METTQSPKITSSIIKGLIISLIIIAVQTAAQFANFYNEPWFKFVPTILLTVFLIWSCIHYANQMHHSVGFGEVFSYGFKTATLITLIMIAYTILVITVIFPELKDQSLQQMRERLEKGGKLSPSEIESNFLIVKKYFIPFTIGITLVLYIVPGLIASLLGGAIAKKKKNPSAI